MRKSNRDIYERVASTIGTPGHIGCSQLGAIFGVSKYDTPFTAGQKILGKVDLDEPTPEQKESMDMGHWFEDAIARWEAERLGVRIAKSNLAWRRKDIPYFVCHPDRLVLDPVEGKRIAFEVKFVSPYAKREWGEEGTDAVPYPYLLQTQGYFACGVDYGRLDEVWIVRMMGNRIRTYRIQRDEELIALILRRVPQYWKELHEGTIPPSTPDEFAEAFPESDPAKVAIADADIGQIIAHRQAEAKAIEVAKKELEGFDMQIRNYMGEAETLEDGFGKRIATLKTQTSSRLDTAKVKKLLGQDALEANGLIKTTTSRVLRWVGKED